MPNPSDAPLAAVGTPSVAEAAALLRGGELLVPKRKSERGDGQPAMATCAVVRRPARGRLAVVGLGPGARDLLTPRAKAELRRASVLVGLDQYVDQIRDLLRPGTRILESGLGAEEERARTAVAEARKGQAVALIGSGDAGVYAMASPALAEASDDIDVVGVPGVTAALAAAAILGAPLGHDHVSISLSDLHTPWEVIERRVRAAAEADIVVTFYNPRSRGRDWQLPKALALLAEHRDAGDAGRCRTQRVASRTSPPGHHTGRPRPGDGRHDDGRDRGQHGDPGHRGAHGDPARLPLAGSGRAPSEPCRSSDRAGVLPAAARPPGHLALPAADPGGRGAGRPLRRRSGVRRAISSWTRASWRRRTRRCTAVRPWSWTWRWSPPGITRRETVCRLRDAESGPGLTRSAHAIRLAYEQVGPGALWVIGNAPTALEELLTLDAAPALVIGLPVGFVGAVESKAALRESGLPAVSNVSEKGGSAVAAAALNALLYHPTSHT